MAASTIRGRPRAVGGAGNSCERGRDDARPAPAVHRVAAVATALMVTFIFKDQANRHTSTTVGSTTVAYTRDATDRLIARTVTGPELEAFWYAFSGAGDTPDLVLDATGAVVERTLALPGGVVVSRPSRGTRRGPTPTSTATSSPQPDPPAPVPASPPTTRSANP